MDGQRSLLDIDKIVVHEADTKVSGSGVQNETKGTAGNACTCWFRQQLSQTCV